jgi:hypothetical protein
LLVLGALLVVAAMLVGSVSDHEPVSLPAASITTIDLNGAAHTSVSSTDLAHGLVAGCALFMICCLLAIATRIPTATRLPLLRQPGQSKPERAMCLDLGRRGDRPSLQELSISRT